MTTANLKRKLKSLNYPTDFSDDSEPLIDKLLSDLILAS